ncbi:MAG TPA: DUF1016 N-terminal domain-containing protein [Gammaproteobacteria bacterium]|nr:DUF1016 N-terminal domain-containing protein [Gammaproteobacteria bacterium]
MKASKKPAKKAAISPDINTLASHFPLPWSTYVRLLSVKDISARTFYEKEAMRGGWSVRQLDRQISSLFHIYDRNFIAYYWHPF